MSLLYRTPTELFWNWYFEYGLSPFLSTINLEGLFQMLPLGQPQANGSPLLQLNVFSCYNESCLADCNSGARSWFFWLCASWCASGTVQFVLNWTVYVRMESISFAHLFTGVTGKQIQYHLLTLSTIKHNHLTHIHAIPCVLIYLNSVLSLQVPFLFVATPTS